MIKMYGWHKFSFRLVIWDEVPNINKYVLEALDRQLKKILDYNVLHLREKVMILREIFYHVVQKGIKT